MPIGPVRKNQAAKSPAPTKPTPPTGLAKPVKPRTQMDEDHAFKRRDWDPKAMGRLQDICMAYPEVVEVEQFGGPWFKVGKKPFCLYGAESEKRADGYHGVDGAAFKVSVMDQSELLKDPRFARTPHLGQHGWTTMRFRRNVAWDEVAELVEIAYLGVAPKRLLAQLPLG